MTGIGVDTVDRSVARERIAASMLRRTWAAGKEALWRREPRASASPNGAAPAADELSPIQDGRLPAAPAEDACTWCDFAAVCGPAAQSVPRRKDSRQLAELTLLRRMK